VPLADSCSYQTEGGACVSSGLANVVVGSCVAAAIVLGYLAIAYNRGWIPFQPVPRFWNSWLGRALSAVGHRVRALDDPTMYEVSLRRDEEERRARAEQVSGTSRPVEARNPVSKVGWLWRLAGVTGVLVIGDLAADALAIDKWIGEMMATVVFGLGAGVVQRWMTHRNE
jgi:hypothetical protein